MTDKEEPRACTEEYLMPLSFGRTQRAEAISIGQKGSKYYVARGSPDRFMLSLMEDTKEVCSQSLPCKHCYFASKWKSRERPNGRVSTRARARTGEIMEDLGGPTAKTLKTHSEGKKSQFSSWIFGNHGDMWLQKRGIKVFGAFTPCIITTSFTYIIS